MKLLIFAHTPPPHHGQSYMVELMLKNFGGDRRSGKNLGMPSPGIECYHVNARFSKSLEDIGEFQGGKLFLILFFCLQAVWCRFRYGVTNFYYVPAPGKRVAVYRDWLVLLLCRPFFKRTILHWHAAGLAKWLETSAQMGTRSFTYRCFKDADLSIVISRYNIADADKLWPKKISVVSNGIPDPCPDYAVNVLPRRRARIAVRRRLAEGASPDPQDLASAGDEPEVLKVLFLAHSNREKGLFAAAHGVRLANGLLAAQKSPLRMKLIATGSFTTEAERAEFDALMASPEFGGALEHIGFVTGARKNRVLREADLFCFPTLYLGENQPVNLIEAMAYGMPIVTTRWRSLPEMFPAGYPGLVDGQEPDKIAQALLRLVGTGIGEELRENFLRRYTLERHLANLAGAMLDLERAGTAPAELSAEPAKP